MKKTFKVLVTKEEYGCGDCPFYCGQEDDYFPDSCGLSKRIGTVSRKKKTLSEVDLPGNYFCPLKKYIIVVERRQK